jgi:pimeloyl-ACP methyl ester carboxylesterase
MPHVRFAHAAIASTSDSINLFYETHGQGPPIVFLHETARSCRSFDLQVAALSDRYQCIVYNARGYPPSDVPASAESYSQDIGAADLGAVLDALQCKDAHVVGVSMGSAVALQFAVRNATRVRSLVLCSVGAGSELKPGEFAANIEATAAKIQRSEGGKLAEILGSPPDRQRLKQKSPEELQKFMEEASRLSPVGLANTYCGVAKTRPQIYTYEDKITAMTIPTLVVVGELDMPCRKACQFLADTIKRCSAEGPPGKRPLYKCRGARAHQPPAGGFCGRGCVSMIWDKEIRSPTRPFPRLSNPYCNVLISVELSPGRVRA